MPDELKELLKNPIEAVGTVEIVAAKGEDGKPDANGNKKMAIAAYNGGLMKVGWGAPVGIELSGLTWRADNAVPVLCQHRTYSIDSICGQATKVKVDGNSLKIDADFMPVSQDAKKVYELAKAGFKFQASVGVSGTDVFYVGPDESATLNGAEVKGECYIVRAGVLNEVSIVPLGADGSTQTAIAAAASTETETKEGKMPTDKNKPVEAEKPDTATVEAAQTAERDRVASVIAACKGHEDIMAQAVKEGWTAEKAELACLKAEKAEAEKAKKQAEIEASRPSAPAIIDLKASAPHDAKTVTAAACMGASMSDSVVEASFKGVDLDAAHDLKITRLSDVFAAFGIQYRLGNDDSMKKALKAAFSNADIPNVLSNVARKFVLAGFGAVGEQWREIAKPRAVTDFKAVKGVRLVMGGTSPTMRARFRPRRRAPSWASPARTSSTTTSPSSPRSRSASARCPAARSTRTSSAPFRRPPATTVRTPRAPSRSTRSPPPTPSRSASRTRTATLSGRCPTASSARRRTSSRRRRSTSPSTSSPARPARRPATT